MGVCALEHDATGRERVDIRCCARAPAVRGQAIGAQAVNGHQHDRTLVRRDSRANRQPVNAAPATARINSVMMTMACQRLRAAGIWRATYFLIS